MEIERTWTQLKALADSKAVIMQYVEDSAKYDIWITENTSTYKTRIWIDTSGVVGLDVTQNNTDKTDFENNYKANANAAISSGEDKIENNNQIRDTAEYTSTVSDNRGYVPKTIIIENGLDQQVSVQCEGSRDSSFTKPLLIGSAFNVAATSDDYKTVSDYFPYFRTKTTASVAPTTGGLTAYFERVKS